MAQWLKYQEFTNVTKMLNKVQIAEHFQTSGCRSTPAWCLTNYTLNQWIWFVGTYCSTHMTPQILLRLEGASTRSSLTRTICSIPCAVVQKLASTTVAVRRLISHCQSGARIVYEHCVLLIIFPTSFFFSLVLRLYMGCIMMKFFVKLLMIFSSFRYISNSKQDMYPKYMIQCSIIGLCSERCCR